MLCDSLKRFEPITSGSCLLQGGIEAGGAVTHDDASDNLLDNRAKIAGQLGVLRSEQDADAAQNVLASGGNCLLIYIYIYIYIYNISFSVYTQQQPRSVSWCCSEPLFEISYGCEEPTSRLRIYAPGLSAGGMGELLLN